MIHIDKFIKKISNFYKKIRNNLFREYHLDKGYNYWIKSLEKSKNRYNSHPIKKQTTKFIQNKQTFYFIVHRVDDDYNHLKLTLDSILRQSYKNYKIFVFSKNKTKKDRTKAKYKPNLINYIDYDDNDLFNSIKMCFTSDCPDYFVFLNTTLFISRWTLEEFLLELNKEGRCDIVYCDENLYSTNTKKYHSPFFKPDWSFDLFLSYNYLGNFFLAHRDILLNSQNLSGESFYNYLLSFTLHSQKIVHIDKVLTHNFYGYNYREDEKVRDMKLQYFNNRYVSFEYNSYTETFIPIYKTNDKDLVSIVIPTKNNLKLLKNCIESIKKSSFGINFEIIVIDNNSDLGVKNQTKEIYSDNKNIKIFDYDSEFNYSKINNFGVTKSIGNILLFLNDDTQFLEANSIAKLAGHTKMELTGAVGAKLLYPDTNIIQHIGLVTLKKESLHSYHNFNDGDLYFNRNRALWNVSAITGACFCIQKEKFEKVGGFNEEFAVTCNDVDLCLKLLEIGLYNVVRNDVILYHYESFTRGKSDISDKKLESYLAENKLLKKYHKIFFERDPYYNTNFLQNNGDYVIDKRDNIEL